MADYETNPLLAAWKLLPPSVREQYASGARSIAELSPGAAVRDVVDESGNMVNAARQGNWIDAASGPAKMAVAALGVMPVFRGGKLGTRSVQEALTTPPIRAYHASPHSFDKFELRPGTGEGTAAFGQGAYLAENPKVAEEYLRQFKQGGGSGHMYEVNIHADPKRIINDDLPFQRSGVPMDVIEKWREAKTPQERMEILRDAGFQGKKYLDAGSRSVGGSGTGTSNYVVFDPKIIEIMKKYGLVPATVAAGAGAATVPGLLDQQGEVH